MCKSYEHHLPLLRLLVTLVQGRGLPVQRFGRLYWIRQVRQPFLPIYLGNVPVAAHVLTRDESPTKAAPRRTVGEVLRGRKAKQVRKRGRPGDEQQKAVLCKAWLELWETTREA